MQGGEQKTKNDGQLQLSALFQVLEIVLSRLPYKAISWVGHVGVRRVLDKFLFSPLHSSLPRHVILTLSLVTASLLVGLTTDDLGVVLGFNVSLAGGGGGGGLILVEGFILVGAVQGGLILVEGLY